MTDKNKNQDQNKIKEDYPNSILNWKNKNNNK